MICTMERKVASIPVKNQLDDLQILETIGDLEGLRENDLNDVITAVRDPIDLWSDLFPAVLVDLPRLL